MSNKGTSLPQACTGMPDVSGGTWGAPERFEYSGSIAGAATDVQQFGDWQEAAEDMLFRFEYRHKDDFTDESAELAIAQLLVSEDEGSTYSIIASASVPVPNNEGGLYYSAIVEGLIRKGLSYKVALSHPFISWGDPVDLPGGISVYQYSNATLIEES